MKPQMICDSCTDDLKQVIEDEDNVYVIDDRVGGLSVMKHNNALNHIVLCEECEEQHRQQLIDNGCWSDLDMQDNTPNITKDFFKNYDDLKRYIEKLNEAHKKT